MMTIIIYTLAAGFVLKVIWNFIVPYELARRKAGSAHKGISIMPGVEVGLLLLLIGAASLSNASSWLHSPKTVALYGSLAIVLSYAHLVVAGIVAGWIMSRFKKGQN